MSNPAKPIEVKRRQGNPGQRPLPAKGALMALVPADRTPPAHLNDAGRKVWTDVLDVAPWVGVSDQVLLLEVAELADERAIMKREVELMGRTLQSPNGAYQAHPLLAHIRDITKQILSSLSLFGLSPSDRARIGAGEVAAVSKLQAMIDKKAAKGQ